jgi:hypothetical protein
MKVKINVTRTYKTSFNAWMLLVSYTALNDDVNYILK